MYHPLTIDVPQELQPVVSGTPGIQASPGANVNVNSDANVNTFCGSQKSCEVNGIVVVNVVDASVDDNVHNNTNMRTRTRTSCEYVHEF